MSIQDFIADYTIMYYYLRSVEKSVSSTVKVVANLLIRNSKLNLKSILITFFPSIVFQNIYFPLFIFHMLSVLDVIAIVSQWFMWSPNIRQRKSQSEFEVAIY